jgi:hypothetical protein
MSDKVWVNVAILDIDGERKYNLLGAYKEKCKAERDQELAESYAGYPLVVTVEQELR